MKKSKKQEYIETEGFISVKRAYGYIRVSTLKQADEGLSLENQTEKIQAWAVLHDYVIVEIIPDEGISATSMGNRGGLQKILEIIEPGESLVVHSFSRLSRNVADFLEIIKRLKEKNCELVVIKEGLDTSSPHGRFAAVMFAAIAELEVEITRERINESLQLKKKKGEFVGRIPYGWKLKDGKGTGLIEVPEEQAVILRIKEMRNTINEKGHPTSYESIAQILNAEQVKPPIKSKEWYYSTISRIYNRGDVNIKGNDAIMNKKSRMIENGNSEDHKKK
jgi:site-specific DNA recombinase